jgi:hypothetical protein
VFGQQAEQIIDAFGQMDEGAGFSVPQKQSGGADKIGQNRATLEAGHVFFRHWGLGRPRYRGSRYGGLQSTKSMLSGLSPPGAATSARTAAKPLGHKPRRRAFSRAWTR